MTVASPTVCHSYGGSAPVSSSRGGGRRSKRVVVSPHRTSSASAVDRADVPLGLVLGDDELGAPGEADPPAEHREVVVLLDFAQLDERFQHPLAERDRRPRLSYAVFPRGEELVDVEPRVLEQFRVARVEVLHGRVQIADVVRERRRAEHIALLGSWPREDVAQRAAVRVEAVRRPSRASLGKIEAEGRWRRRGGGDRSRRRKGGRGGGGRLRRARGRRGRTGREEDGRSRRERSDTSMHGRCIARPRFARDRS
jgi:hypothetical protein